MPDSELNARATQVASLTPIQLPLSRTMQFRDSNLETIQLVNGPTDFDGVLTDAVRAASSACGRASPGKAAASCSRKIAAWPSASCRTCSAACRRNSRCIRSKPSSCRSRWRPRAASGLPDAWLRKFELASPNQRQVLSIVRLVGGSPAVGRLKQGDILLAIDDKVVTKFREVELAVADKPEVNVTVWRDGEEKLVTLATAALTGNDIDRIVMWAGATLQAPHRAMIAQRGIPPEGVYVGYFAYGSPATRYGLFPGRRIVEVDGMPTPNLDAFLKVVSGRPDRSAIRLRTITWNNAPEVITLKLDRHYWPTYELNARQVGRGPRDQVGTGSATAIVSKVRASPVQSAAWSESFEQPL